MQMKKNLAMVFVDFLRICDDIIDVKEENVMVTLEQLRDWGADVDAAMLRCLNNEAFYLRLVGKAVREPSFEELREALEAGDLSKAFDRAHALKGVTGNLALTPIDKPVREITEHLRSRTDMDYMPLLSEILAQRASLLALCE